MSLIKIMVLCLLLCIAIPSISQAKVEFKEGDIVFQHIPSKLGAVIADVSNSDYSHVGIVVNKNGILNVLEAIGPVKYTSINEWIHQGFNNEYTQLRLQPKYHHVIKPAINEAKKLLGKPYDLQYELDEKKIYCSELIYKAFKRAANLELGKIERLKELNWVPHTLYIIYLTGGELP
ncbi:hypothetical protein BVY03_00805, partial [bacterium K02(2017)]